MRIGGERRSDNVEDRRGIRVSRKAVGVGGGIDVLRALYYEARRIVGVELNVHLRAAHAGDGGAVLPAFPIEQGERIARLEAQHLHMARRGSRQAQGLIGSQCTGGVNAWHIYTRPKA